MKTVAATAVIASLAGTRALACSICFGMESGPVTAGVRVAVIVLIGVTVGVLAGFAYFIRGFVRRASKC
jgi:hypothetical protein